MSEMLMMLSAAFFQFEMISMVYTYKTSKQWDNSLFVHHILGLWGSWVILSYRCSHFFGLAVLVEEISTPFTWVSWILQKSGRSSGKFFLYNQLAMCTVWFFLRSCMDYLIW